jgi:hypothetical protein
MSHFAYIEDGIVTNVLSIEQEMVDTGDFGEPSKFIQTSYNTIKGVHHDPETGEPDEGIPLRMNFARVGDIYDKNLDAFYAPQPFKSWSLDQQSCSWNPPVPMPKDGNFYQWDEPTLTWKEVAKV